MQSAHKLETPPIPRETLLRLYREMVRLRTLQAVGGTLTIDAAATEARLDPPVMPLLSSVGGDLVINHSSFACSTSAARWASLHSVAGRGRRGGGSRFEQEIGATGAVHLTLGALSML